MRQARLKGEGLFHIHVMSRIVQRQFLIRSTEKEKLRELILNQSYFAGLEVVTLCILDNHFHVLLEVPDRELVPNLTVDELFKRLPFIYSEAKIKELRKKFDEAELACDQGRIDRMLAGFAQRMGDVSFYMKEVKQKFSQWYNLRVSVAIFTSLRKGVIPLSLNDGKRPFKSNSQT